MNESSKAVYVGLDVQEVRVPGERERPDQCNVNTQLAHGNARIGMVNT